jgi:hypothetical protein
MSDDESKRVQAALDLERSAGYLRGVCHGIAYMRGDKYDEPNFITNAADSPEIAADRACTMLMPKIEGAAMGEYAPVIAGALRATADSIERGARDGRA